MTVEARDRVRWSDVDIMGVMRFDRYLRFAEAAETEFFRSAGFTYEQLAREHGVWFARVRLEVDYRAAARMDDIVVTRAVLTQIGGSSLRFRFPMHKEEDGSALAEAVLVIAAVDTATLRPARLPGPLRDALQP